MLKLVCKNGPFWFYKKSHFQSNWVIYWWIFDIKILFHEEIFYIYSKWFSKFYLFLKIRLAISDPCQGSKLYKDLVN